MRESVVDLHRKVIGYDTTYMRLPSTTATYLGKGGDEVIMLVKMMISHDLYFQHIENISCSSSNVGMRPLTISD